MTDKQYMTCVAEAQSYSDRDTYISDMALSSMWGDAPDTGIPPVRTEQLGSIYDAVHRNIKEIAADAGISVRALAIRFCIPVRTAESWYNTGSSSRQCPLYVRLMIQECLGLLRR